jgi:RHS repeat-associated protein
MRKDPTGFIWMGARYYDPSTGRFLSPDPIGYPACLDLYNYANGDPINYCDPDGRYANHAFAVVKSTTVELGALTIWGQLKLHYPEPAKTYRVGEFGKQDKAIFTNNGIHTPLERAMGMASMISNYAGGHYVHHVYNASNGFLLDAERWYLSCKHDMCSPPIIEQQRQWYEFFGNASSDATALTICYSEGVTNVRNALKTFDEKLRMRIEVIAYCPSAYIDPNLCKRVVHYCSTRDLIPRLVQEGFYEGKKNVVYLTPHPNAPIHDHDAESPTFSDSLLARINNYLMR